MRFYMLDSQILVNLSKKNEVRAKYSYSKNILLYHSLKLGLGIIPNPILNTAKHNSFFL